jgi:hypothetical protein
MQGKDKSNIPSGTSGETVQTVLTSTICAHNAPAFEFNMQHLTLRKYSQGSLRLLDTSHELMDSYNNIILDTSH